MKRWLIYDYDNRKEVFKMYKKVIKSNNQEADRKAYNRMFVLKELGLDYESREDTRLRGTYFTIKKKSHEITDRFIIINLIFSSHHQGDTASPASSYISSGLIFYDRFSFRRLSNSLSRGQMGWKLSTRL